MFRQQKYFLLLDCHQAAVAIAVFEIIARVPLAFSLKLVNLVMQNSPALYEEAVKHIGDKTYQKIQWLANFGFIYNAIAAFLTLMIIIAVFEGKNKKWLMMPWMLLAIFEFVKSTHAFVQGVELIYQISTSTLALILLSAVFIFGIIVQCYKIVTVIASFRLLGATKKDDIQPLVEQRSEIIQV